MGNHVWEWDKKSDKPMMVVCVRCGQRKPLSEVQAEEEGANKMELEKAKAIANEVVTKLAPYCTKIEVAGSIRRRKPFPADIDIVLIPTDLWNLTREIKALGPAKVSGDKLKRVNYNGVQVDLYFASPQTWATLLLIRTGSKENNIRLATLAKKKGWHLTANGNGLFDEKGRRIAGDSERSIYETLGLPYKEPWERG